MISFRSFAVAILVFTLFLLLSPSYIYAQNSQSKRIEINLSNQHLYAYEGEKLKYEFLVSSGKWFPTPTGTFNVWYKTPSNRMRGGNIKLGTYYDLPNVPWNMYFYKDYAIHGAYWHKNFGHPMSHGCVNLLPEDARLLYSWTEYTTPIKIYGMTPSG